jgi:hypothetical protein
VGFSRDGRYLAVGGGRYFGSEVGYTMILINLEYTL